MTASFLKAKAPALLRGPATSRQLVALLLRSLCAVASQPTVRGECLCASSTTCKVEYFQTHRIYFKAEKSVFITWSLKGMFSNIFQIDFKVTLCSSGNAIVARTNIQANSSNARRGAPNRAKVH